MACLINLLTIDLVAPRYEVVFFAMALSQMPGYHISFVVMDHMQPKVERYGEIDVYRHSHYGKRGTFYKRLNDNLTGYIGKRERFPYVEIREFTPSLIVKLPVFGSLFLARKLLLLSRNNSEPPALHDRPVPS